ncbi:MAG: pyrimidine 5'-nucleotidase [Rhodospirillaceae bacterium]|jgi:putative hydrolase of the HAD superfamily
MSYDHLIHMETWVFDLDNTLYPVELNLFDQIDKRMCGYIADYLQIDHAEAYKVQKSFFREHGTSLKGMMDVHDMDPGPYLDYVHDIDFDAVVPDARLDAALSVLKGRKVVFTNAATKYAERVLDRLGIRHHFDGVFDIVDADYRPKPDPAVYDKVVEVFDFDPANAIMVEDIARNLKPAAEMGMKTVWVMTDRPWAHTEAETANPDYHTNSLSAWLAEVTGV